MPSTPQRDRNELDFEELRRRFVEAKNFGEFWLYFLDHFGEQRAFVEVSVPSLVPQLEEIASILAGKILGKAAKFDECHLFRLNEEGIVHGMVSGRGFTGALLYFDNLERGLFVMNRPGGQTDLARFTTSLGQAVAAKYPKDRKSNRYN